MTRIFRYAALALAALSAGPLVRMTFDTAVQAQDTRVRDWRAASAPAGWAPAPDDHPDAVVQAYCAPVVRWRGAFGDHCWVAAKATGAATYRRYEVIGWNVRRGRSAVSVSETAAPDREWYGARPKLIQDIRGDTAARIAAALPAAADSYPYPNRYRMWPGPNSNTFIAHLGRRLPELNLVLPGRAIGKDYIPGNVVARTPSGTGVQASLAGLVGVSVGAGEGLEVNVLGLVVGIDPLDFAVTLPGIGRLPLKDDWTDGRAARDEAAVETAAGSADGAAAGAQ